MSKLEVNAIDSVGSTLTLGDTNATTLALNSGITTLPSTLTNTPAWNGHKSAQQVLSRATYTKITGFTMYEIDTDSAFDGTTFTVPTGKGGKYFIYFKMYADYGTTAGNDGEYSIAQIRVNGSSIDANGLSQFSNQVYMQDTIIAQTIRTLSAGDTVEAWGYIKDASGGTGDVASSYSSFGGYRIIGA